MPKQIFQPLLIAFVILFLFIILLVIFLVVYPASQLFEILGISNGDETEASF